MKKSITLRDYRVEVRWRGADTGPNCLSWLVATARDKEDSLKASRGMRVSSCEFYDGSGAEKARDQSLESCFRRTYQTSRSEKEGQGRPRVSARGSVLALIVFLLSLSVSSTQLSSKSSKRAKTPSSFPVSKYMRKMGLLYLQTMGEFTKKCEGLDFVNNAEAQQACKSAIQRGNEALEQIEGYVDIELSDSPHHGDVMTWNLLKQAKISKMMSLRSYLPNYFQEDDYRKAMMKLWGQADAACGTYAEGAVKDGLYIENNGCSQRVQEAISYKGTPLSISPELRVRCAPFAGGSADKVLEGTMSMPPEECRPVLAWMRDGRLTHKAPQP